MVPRFPRHPERKNGADLLLVLVCAAWIACASPSTWPEPLYHEVQSGETVNSVARAYDVDPGWLGTANGIRDRDQALAAGTRLLIPGTGRVVHVVRPGDTLDSIASQYRVDGAAIARINDLAQPDRIAAGMRLRLPPAARPPSPSPAASASAFRPEPAAPFSHGEGAFDAARAPDPPIAERASAPPAAPPEVARAAPPAREVKGAAPPAREVKGAAPPATPGPASAPTPAIPAVASAPPAAIPEVAGAPPPATPEVASAPPTPTPDPTAALAGPADLLERASEAYLGADFLDARDRAARAGAALAGQPGPEAARMRAHAAFVEGSAWAGLGDEARAVEAYARSRALAPEFEPPAEWMSPRLRALYERSARDPARAAAPETPLP